MPAPARLAGLAANALLAFASTGLGQDTGSIVELRAKDGSATIIGELLEITEDGFVIRTDLGELRIMRDLVTCVGDACENPNFQAETHEQSASEVTAEPSKASEEKVPDIPVIQPLAPFITTFATRNQIAFQPEPAEDNSQSIVFADANETEFTLLITRSQPIDGQTKSILAAFDYPANKAGESREQQSSCKLNGNIGVFETKAGDDPDARPIYFQFQQDTLIGRQLVEFLSSEPGQEALVEGGLVDLSLSLPNDPDGYREDRLTAARAEQQNAQIVELFNAAIDGAARLSATFRFEANAGRLDDRTQDDLARLQRFISAAGLASRDLLVLGFADQSGGYDSNLLLSRERARTIANALAERGLDVKEVIGFGEEAPISCNDDPAGRAKNRRVEIWLR